ATRAEILRNQEDRRRAALNQVLEGELTQPSQELENLLGYRLRGFHLGVVLDVEDRAQAERAVSDLVARSGARGSLLTLHGPGTWAAWLSFAAAPGPSTRTLLTAAATATGIPTAIGVPSS